jgi:hypothetical protein
VAELKIRSYQTREEKLPYSCNQKWHKIEGKTTNVLLQELEERKHKTSRNCEEP